MCCLLSPFPQRRTQGFSGAGNIVRQLLNNRSQKEFVGQYIKKVFWGLTGLVEEVTSIALEGSLSPFPGSVPAVTAEFLPRSAESSAWTQGNNLLWKRQSPNSFRPWAEGPTGNVPLWQRQGISRSWTPPPCMESEVLTVGYQTKPSSPFGHYPKCHRPTLALLQSLELRFSHLGIQTFLPQPGYTKPEALWNAGSRGVLPSLQMVQHWIFK